MVDSSSCVLEHKFSFVYEAGSDTSSLIFLLISYPYLDVVSISPDELEEEMSNSSLRTEDQTNIPVYHQTILEPPLNLNKPLPYKREIGKPHRPDQNDPNVPLGTANCAFLVSLFFAGSCDIFVYQKCLLSHFTEGFSVF